MYQKMCYNHLFQKNLLFSLLNLILINLQELLANHLVNHQIPMLMFLIIKHHNFLIYIHYMKNIKVLNFQIVIIFFLKFILKILLFFNKKYIYLTFFSSFIRLIISHFILNVKYFKIKVFIFVL